MFGCQVDKPPIAVSRWRPRRRRVEDAGSETVFRMNRKVFHQTKKSSAPSIQQRMIWPLATAAGGSSHRFLTCLMRSLKCIVCSVRMKCLLIPCVVHLTLWSVSLSAPWQGMWCLTGDSTSLARALGFSKYALMALLGSLSLA